MSQRTVPHDAPRAIADLRDHLARHDKPIAFLFGAGTSCAVQARAACDATTTEPLIPDVARLTERCERATVDLGKDFAQAWKKIKDQCIIVKQQPNIENIISRLRMMIRAIGPKDVLAGLNKAQLIAIERVVRQTIAECVAPTPDLVPDELPHHEFARWLLRTSRDHPIEIFTVNYDTLIESALEAELIPVFDGFVGIHKPFFHPDSLRHTELSPGVKWTRLWKMHGSVTWSRVTTRGRSRIIRGEPNTSGEMILPSFEKYDESRQQPYVAFMDRLMRFLELDNALLIVVGFSFADEHINDVIFGALENHPRTHVYAIQYEELDDNADLIERSYRRRNIIVVGPETGIIGGRRARWSLAQEHPFVEEVCHEISDQKGPPIRETFEPEKLGRMKIVDFREFCSFLSSMTPR